MNCAKAGQICEMPARELVFNAITDGRNLTVAWQRSKADVLATPPAKRVLETTNLAVHRGICIVPFVLGMAFAKITVRDLKDYGCRIRIRPYFSTVLRQENLVR